MSKGTIVAVAIVLGLVLLQGQTSFVGRRIPTWPPAPENIVNIALDDILVSANTVLDLYAVPTNKWLVLTDVRVFEDFLASNYRINLVQNLSGSLELRTARRTNQETLAQRRLLTGLAFSPGSSVALHSTNQNPGSSDRVSVELGGYLIDIY